jgi:hypothetical protein
MVSDCCSWSGEIIGERTRWFVPLVSKVELNSTRMLDKPDRRCRRKLAPQAKGQQHDQGRGYIAKARAPKEYRLLVGVRYVVTAHIEWSNRRTQLSQGHNDQVESRWRHTAQFSCSIPSLFWSTKGPPEQQCFWYVDSSQSWLSVSATFEVWRKLGIGLE